MVSIRRARPADSAGIESLVVASIRAFGPEAYDDDQVTAWAYTEDPDYPIDDPDHVVVVAETGAGNLAGFGDVAPTESELYAVYVHPDHAREGVGTAILDCLERTARERGVERLELTASRNAVGFYQRAGYERLGTVEHEPSGPHEVVLGCVRMGRTLHEKK